MFERGFVLALIAVLELGVLMGTVSVWRSFWRCSMCVRRSSAGVASREVWNAVMREAVVAG